jgi:L-asparaginase
VSPAAESRFDMTDADHELIAQTAGSMSAAHDGVVIVHGTDTLSVTGEHVVAQLGTPRVPSVLTGAMKPYVMRSTDALQNLTESLLAVQVFAPGVYLAMHNRVLQFPGVVKDRDRGVFTKPS